MDENQYREMVFEESRKKKRVAYLLWFFFGLFGAHRFYAGRTGSGIAQLLISLTVIGIPLVTLWWALFDAFLIPDMINERNLEKLRLINGDRVGGPASVRDEAKSGEVELDPRREQMLEDLRQTGYRKDRRDEISTLYR